jgi:hypothetical protein
VTAIAVSVYEEDGTTLIAHVPRRRNVQFLDELNGDGHGQFDIHLDDPLLTEKPALLAGGNIVKMRPTHVTDPVFAWQIEEVAQAFTPQGEVAERWATVQGRGVRTLLASGILYPEHGLAATSADDRGFSYASDTGSWLVSADWVTPYGVQQGSDPTARGANGGYPTGWPDPTAEWIWSSDPTATAAAGRNWFRATFTLASDADVGVFAAGDNVLQLSLNGDVILETEDPTDLFSWKQMQSTTLPLTAGTYTVAARVDNLAATSLNPGGFLCTIATLDGDGIPLVELLHTNTTDWTVHSYGPPEPGWHAASILKTVIEESQARSEVQIVPLTLGFTDTDDTDSVAWDDIQAERFPIASDLLTMLGRLIELGLDAEVTPDLVVNAWKRRGADLRTSVTLLPGRDIVANVPTTRYAPLRNSTIIRHGTGWVLVEDATSIGDHGRRSTGLTLGSTDSDAQATQQAQAFFDESAQPQVTLPITLMSESGGPQPYDAFGLGDVVTCPRDDGALGPARAMSFEAKEGAASDGVVVWDVAFYPEV